MFGAFSAWLAGRLQGMRSTPRPPLRDGQIWWTHPLHETILVYNRELGPRSGIVVHPTTLERADLTAAKAWSKIAYMRDGNRPPTPVAFEPRPAAIMATADGEYVLIPGGRPGHAPRGQLPSMLIQYPSGLSREPAGRYEFWNMISLSDPGELLQYLTRLEDCGAAGTGEVQQAFRALFRQVLGLEQPAWRGRHAIDTLRADACYKRGDILVVANPTVNTGSTPFLVLSDDAVNGEDPYTFVACPLAPGFKEYAGSCPVKLDAVRRTLGDRSVDLMTLRAITHDSTSLPPELVVRLPEAAPHVWMEIVDELNDVYGETAS